MSVYVFVRLLSFCVVAFVGDIVGVRHDVIERSDDTVQLQDVVTQQSQLITQMQARIEALDAKIASLQAKTDSAQQVVAFMVTLPQNQDLTSNSRLDFANPSLNVGGGFNSNIHSFVIPVTGLYVFFLKVGAFTEIDSGHYITFGLKLEGAVLAETETNDDDNADRASVQVIAHARQGQHVWAEKVGGGGHTVSGGMTTFGGFLLRAGDTL